MIELFDQRKAEPGFESLQHRTKYYYDANGNVGDLADTSGHFVAHYEYGPFHETLRLIGTIAQANPFRSSTKFADIETGNVYYGYRYYLPGTSRWLNRDPIEEPANSAFLTFIDYDKTILGAFRWESQFANALLGTDPIHVLNLYAFVELTRFAETGSTVLVSL